MRKSVRFGRLFSLLMICLMAAGTFLCPSTARADNNVGSIAFEFGEKMEGVEFSIYKVAVPDNRGGHDLTPDFAGYPVDLTDITAAETLEGYVLRDEIVPLQKKATDEEGNILFDELTIGYYLILGQDFILDNTRYEMQPVLVNVPGKNIVSGELEWDVIISAKYDKIPIHYDPPMEVTVKKVWVGDSEKVRPQMVMAQLLGNGEVQDEVELNKDNNWSYTWMDLDPTVTWKVVEKDVPEEYVVSITRKDTDTTFVIENTYTEPPTEPETETPKKPTKPNETTTPEEPHEPPHLPQTGQLWWPVSLLLCGGLLCLTLGVLIRKRR